MPIFKLSSERFEWFPLFDSWWISIHQIILNNTSNKELKNIKKKLFILKNKIKDNIIFSALKEQIKGQKDGFSKKNKFIGNLTF